MTITRPDRTSDIIVVGAGVTGVWTGAPGAPQGLADDPPRCVRGRSLRATSGDETRIIRASHGADRFYVRAPQATVRTGADGMAEGWADW
jgi:hypothetical protein